MNTSMEVAAAHRPAPATVTTVKHSISRPTVNRESSHAPIGIIRNRGACAAASSGP